MKQVGPFIAIALAAGTMVTCVEAGQIDAPLARALETSRSPQHVIVALRAPASARLKKAPSGRAEALERLKANAEESQAPLRALLGNQLATADGCRPLWIINGVCLTASPEMVRMIASRPDVEAVYLDEEVRLETTRVDPIPDRERAVLEAGLRAPGDTAELTYGLVKLGVPELWQTHRLTGAGVRVGVIDTGIDASHPDLAGKVLAWRDFIGDKPEPYDDQGHGTHVAGTIAGGASSGLAIGVAPDAKLIVAKIFSASGSTSTEKILAAMQWIADPDGDSSTADAPVICSNSWGGGPGRKVFLEATKNWVALGIFPSFAAGNSGPGAGTVGTPGGFLEAFAVGATDLNDQIASFSSRGPVTWDGATFTKPDVSAPGKAVTSAKAGGGYTALSGTSMATPHISGVLALLYQAKPTLTIAEARELLERTSDDQGDAGKDNTFGAGRANAVAAAQVLVSGSRVSSLLTDAGQRAAVRAMMLDVLTPGTVTVGTDRSSMDHVGAAIDAGVTLPRDLRRAVNAQRLERAARSIE